jgi:hypothetical protein
MEAWLPDAVWTVETKKLINHRVCVTCLHEKHDRTKTPRGIE